MQTSPEIKNITAAIIAVMKEVKGIEKSMTVGKGQSAYQGVSDQSVKKEIGAAMEKNGLCLVPTEITPTLQIDRWEEADQYNNGAMKQKQQVFTEVKTKYLLLHDSGEWIEISGYGHGVDTMDKAAGKATTYALKYTLLYTFMVPTGKIDDADASHSDDQPTPQNRVQPRQQQRQQQQQPTQAQFYTQWQDEINKLASKEDVISFYNRQRIMIDGDVKLKEMISKRRKEVEPTTATA